MSEEPTAYEHPDRNIAMELVRATSSRRDPRCALDRTRRQERC